jgi:hypothetical protein
MPATRRGLGADHRIKPLEPAAKRGVAVADHLEERLYRIQPQGNHSGLVFLAGNTSDGRQFLLGPCRQHLVAIEFSPTGEMRAVQRHPFPEEVQRIARSPLPPKGGPSRAAALIRRAREQNEAVASAGFAWAERFGVLAGPIMVQRFFVDDALIGIGDQAAAFERMTAGSDCDVTFADWERSGEYVLWWGREYVMNAQGKIVAA